ETAKEEARIEEKEAEANEEVQVNALAGHDHLTFQASRRAIRSGKHATTGAEFSAFAVRREGGVSVAAVAFVLLGKASLFKPPDPEGPTAEAIVNPPAPFLGSATFKRDAAEPSSWTGD